MDEEKVKAEFGAFGTVTSCKIMVDAEKKSKGFGFVCFSTPEEAKEAVEQLNGRISNGKPLYVSLAQRKEVRRAQLEQQHNNRNKMGMPQGMPPHQMYPPQAPMFYAPGIPPTRQFMYPGQMVPRNARYPPNGQNPQMMGGRPVNYQLMPVPNGRNPQQQGPRQGGQRNRRNNNGPNMQGQRRNMQGQPMMGNPQQQQQQQQRAPADQQQTQTQETSSAVVPATTDQAQPLTIKQLAAAPENQQKQMIGERLYPLIAEQQPSRAGKITGMLLEMDNGELIHLLESPGALQEKVQEAMAVLAHATE
jgi:polyadenylate-binding protein